MDAVMAWLQAKLGPVTFGAAAGFVLQVIISRPRDWLMALERAIAAFLMSVVFSPLIAKWVEHGLGMDRDYALIMAATLCAIGGIELLRKIRSRLLKAADTVKIPGVDGDG